MQRLAARLINRCYGLGRGHSGAICDAITAAGIDPAAWTAREITDALNADMRASGWAWPDHIQRPGAFLAHRLKRIDWTSYNDGGYAAGLDEGTGRPQPQTCAITHTRITEPTADRVQQEDAHVTGRAALGGAGHTAARAALAEATRRAATRRTHTAAAEAAQFAAAIAAARTSPAA